MPNTTAKTETLEFEGKTIEQATEYACKHFSLSMEELNIEILSKGSSGIFGLGGRKARIRAVPNTALKKPAINKSKPSNNASATGESPNLIEESGDSPETAGVSPPMDSPPHMDEARQLTDELLKKMGLICNVEIKKGAEGANIEIIGQDISIAIGHEGRALEAIEYIINRAIAKRFEDAKTIFIDAGDFHSNREGYLVKLAHSKADQARKTGKSVILNPMSPRERRMVHLTLKNVIGIRTASTGTGTMRKVIIIPARRAHKSSNQRSTKKSE